MAKAILIKAVIKGSGIVNFDSNDQKYSWNRQKNVERCNFNNTMFGKGRYYSHSEKNSEGEDKEYLTKVGVISADCIRHTMYDDVMSIHLPNVMHDNELLTRVIAHPAFIERGYMFAKDTVTWKRKSAFALSYARAVTESVPALETYSNTQPKTGENKSEESAETSFFKREVRGESIYELSGQIDIKELGFISMSDVHDRMSIHPDCEAQYRKILGERFGSEISEPGFFLKNGDLYGIPEYGIQLSTDQVKFLVTDILKRLARFNLVRTVTGYARTISLSIKFVNDPLEDLFNNEDGWINIFNGKSFDLSALDSVTLEVGYSKTDLHEEASQKIASYKKKFGYVKGSSSDEEGQEKKPRGRTKKDKSQEKVLVVTDDTIIENS